MLSLSDPQLCRHCLDITAYWSHFFKKISELVIHITHGFSEQEFVAVSKPFVLNILILIFLTANMIIPNKRFMYLFFVSTLKAIHN
jgi:hypothetical protein